MEDVSRLTFDEFDVGTVAVEADQSKATLVFAHGAGAGMQHSTLQQISEALASKGISTFRFNFPYMEAGKNRVDSKDVSTRTIEAALESARARLNGPYFLGGHSFGGRMASHAVVDREVQVEGLVFCSFPLHNPKKPSLDRAEHMSAINCPMLFLSGSRDGMASPELITKLVKSLKAEMHWLDTADHGYKVLKRSRQRDDDVFTEIAGYVSDFVDWHTK